MLIMFNFFAPAIAACVVSKFLLMQLDSEVILDPVFVHFSPSFGSIPTRFPDLAVFLPGSRT
jgi:hypothetical protein